MQGRARTQPTDNLSAIFWHIRTERDSRTRRSWQRRARQALATLDLTPAERHEVMAVWSRPDNARIDSPALRKLTGQPRGPGDWQTRPARSVTRARFDDAGQPTRARKKAGSPRLDFTLWTAVNDPVFCTTPTPPTPRQTPAPTQSRSTGHPVPTHRTHKPRSTTKTSSTPSSALPLRAPLVGECPASYPTTRAALFLLVAVRYRVAYPHLMRLFPPSRLPRPVHGRFSYLRRCLHATRPDVFRHARH